MYAKIIKCDKMKKNLQDRWREERLFFRMAYSLGDVRKAAFMLQEFGIPEKRLYSILVKWSNKGIYNPGVTLWQGFFNIHKICCRHDKYTETLGRWK